jgi:hypothetical protein
MRSRAFQLVLVATAIAASAGTAVFIGVSEQRIATTRSAERGFDAVVRQVTSSVAEFRSEGVTKSMDALRSMATTDKARAALEQAASKTADFTEIAVVLDQVNVARVAEQDAADAEEASQRKLEATALAGAAAVSLAVMAGLFFFAPQAAAAPVQTAAVADPVASRPDDLVAREPEVPGYVTARPAGPVLRAASLLCTDLGRVSDVEELRELVGRVSLLMDASGLIVWMSSPDGAQLLPALSHGYAADMLARFPPLSRSANNAVATAFRTGQQQIVLARPGESNGAIVAPVLSSSGCVGVISAEIRGGGETSESVQALAVIFAAQLAGVLHTTPAAHERRAATGTDDA